MKMNEAIRYFRLQNHLTQEQVASRLGVTAPAVNKWEKGTSCPDITLLPALARLLGTDCNTLLCFQEELSDSQIAVLMNEMQACLQEKGLQEGYEWMMQKLREYPSCEALAYYAALLLEGALMYETDQKQDTAFYRKEIERLCEFAAKSKKPDIKDQALASLISKKIETHDWEQAERLLEQMTPPPKSFGTNQKQLQAKLYMEKQEYAQAAKLLEEELAGQKIYIDSILLTLMKIALKENCLEEAQKIASVHDQIQQLLGLGVVQSRFAEFWLSFEQKNRTACCALLSEILKAFDQVSNPNQQTLYRHLKTKEPTPDFSNQMKKMFLRGLDCDPEAEFLRDMPEVQEWMRKYL